MGSDLLSINLVTDTKTFSISFDNSTTAEEVCISLCKYIGVSPVARHIFALQDAQKKHFLIPSANFSKKYLSYNFRIRFKVVNIARLKDMDLKAYEYYFHQARCDVLNNNIPDLIYDKHKTELLGLGITDMYRVMLEKGLSREVVENDYKKYIPKEVIKQHMFFIKKPISDHLSKIKKVGYNASYVKMEYLKQLDLMVPEYLAEDYKALTDQNGIVYNVFIRVSPYHPTLPGIRISFDPKRENWQQICSIQDICYISLRQDGTVEISRKNGIPYYLKFFTFSVMLSFVSLLDGYYRLSCKWIFNICKDVATPSLQQLYATKCHGPVGGEFSYAKLEDKRDNRAGCFILRESELKYGTYYIDVCVKNNKIPKTYKLEKMTNDEFVFSNDLTKYNSIQQLVHAYSDPQGEIYLYDCLPPSEYDKSPLLLCHNDHISSDFLTESSDTMPSAPLCINSHNLQVYKGQKKDDLRGITTTYRCLWKVTKTKKIEVAMKMLKNDKSETHLKGFLDLAGNWAFLNSSSIVRLYGVTMINPVSMILEHVRLGPLNEYLRNNRSIVKPVDLIEACSHLASALWHLEENGTVHGNIRCRKLLVSYHDENKFIVKLGDPGVHHSYDRNEIHWIPTECYSNFEFARKSTSADVWAFATTVWEIFTYGSPINSFEYNDAIKWYTSGRRLPQPSDCPNNIFKILKECWNVDPHRRKQPQAIMRDVNQILYQVYNSRRIHSYAKINAKTDLESRNSSACSIATNSTELSSIDDYQDELLSIHDKDKVDDKFNSSSNSEVDSKFSNFLLDMNQENNDDDVFSNDLSNTFSNFTFSTSITSVDSISSMQSIFELDADCNVILQGRVGQGFYGEVYKATMENLGDKDCQPKLVAVKKLKTSAANTCIQDFEREISIMKTLKHPNIVEILGVLQEPEVSLVMEYVQHGSLQSYLKIYRETLSTKQLLKYSLDIALGMDYLGTKHIVHRDLAARNILVVNESHVKISDFGLAQVMGTNEYYILKTNRELPIKWYAPESLRDGKFSSASDVWSYGVTMCEMFGHGEEPNLHINHNEKEEQEQQLLLNAIESGARFPCPSVCPQSVYVCLIYPCWKGNPHERPSFFQLCKKSEELLLQY